MEQGRNRCRSDVDVPAYRPNSDFSLDRRTPAVAILTAILNTLIVLTCLFLICLILIQRGKGGGLAGAFGGVGGSSAFGTKSGDVFTRVTMVVASVWIILSMILVVLYNQGGQSAWGTDSNVEVSKEIAPKSSKGKAKAGVPGAPKPAEGTGGASSPVTVPPIPDAPTSTPASSK
jgi:preprotein translocase subunit SecG